MPSVTITIARDDTNEAVAQIRLDESKVAAMNHEKYGGVVAWLLAGPLRETSCNVERRVAERATGLAIAERQLPPESIPEQVAFVIAREKSNTRQRIEAQRESDLMKVTIAEAKYLASATDEERISSAEEKARIIEHYDALLARTADLLTPDAIKAVTI